MASTLNVNSLTDYVNVHKDELFIKSAVGAKSIEYMDIMGNVKYKDALVSLDSTATLQDGSACGFNAAGADVFAEKYIEVKPVKVEKEWCAQDFRTKFANYALKFEAGRETLPFEEKLAESNVEAVKMAVEDVIWKGDSALGIDGLKAQAMATASNEVQAGATVSECIDALVAAMPVSALAKGVNIFMSYTAFRAYVQEQNASCCANRTLIDAAADAITYAGDSRITLVPVAGLEGANIMIGASKENLVYGTDIEGSEAVYRLWYDEKDDMFRFRIRFNAGTAIRIDEDVRWMTVQ